MNGALVALEAQVRAEFAKTAHPGAAWLAPKLDPDGRPALDVLVIGAGQSGIATAFGLMRSQVTNILVLDKAEEGREGRWLTYARMHTLRSPKDFTGPDLDIPSLTYQSWHEAQFGEDDWRSIDLIPRELWAEYLLWFRRVVDLPVRNGCEVVEVLPAAGGLLAANVQTAAGIDTFVCAQDCIDDGVRRAWATGQFQRRCAICRRRFACIRRNRSTSPACAANRLQ
jgi:FAD-dependent urate hydroxylase